MEIFRVPFYFYCITEFYCIFVENYIEKKCYHIFPSLEKCENNNELDSKGERDRTTI